MQKSWFGEQLQGYIFGGSWKANRRAETAIHHVMKIRQEADKELQNRGWEESAEEGANFKIEFEIGTIQVNLSQEAISLMRALGSGILKEELSDMAQKDTLKLTEWYSKMSTRYRGVVDIAIDRSGFVVKTEGMRFMNTDEREIT